MNYGGNHSLFAAESDANETEEEDYVASVSILVQLFMLGVTFVIGHVLRRNKIMVVHEAGAALLLGVLVGMFVRISGATSGFSTWINFNNSFFFYFLLPPIIFESGWSLKTRPFFTNFGAICVFAFLGTIISTFVVGILIWIFGAWQWTYSMPFMVCLTFGALISATDPVTVLAVFNELGVDEDLYAYVFGESVLNDAVAIVMYRTVLTFVTRDINGWGIFEALWYFIANFIGSFSIGVICSLGSALLFKYGGFNDQGLGILESCLVVLFPYCSYMMADALELSGIVAILFAGITMKYYTAPLMSSGAVIITTSFFQMLAKLSETFVFIYMGVALFLEKQSWENIGFTFFTIFSILVARVLNVYPCARIVNHFREERRHIPKNQQHALWFSGLRGAMAFALSLQSVTDLPNHHGQVLLTSTLFTIFFTVLLIGGSTPFCLQYLEIMCHGPSGHGAPGVAQAQQSELAQDIEMKDDDEGGVDPNNPDLNILERQRAKLQKKLHKLKQEATFENLDQKYLKPFFASSASEASRESSRTGSPPLASPTGESMPRPPEVQRSQVVDSFKARSDSKNKLSDPASKVVVDAVKAGSDSFNKLGNTASSKVVVDAVKVGGDSFNKLGNTASSKVVVDAMKAGGDSFNKLGNTASSKVVVDAMKAGGDSFNKLGNTASSKIVVDAMKAGGDSLSKLGNTASSKIVVDAMKAGGDSLNKLGRTASSKVVGDAVKAGKDSFDKLGNTASSKAVVDAVKAGSDSLNKLGNTASKGAQIVPPPNYESVRIIASHPPPDAKPHLEGRQSSRQSPKVGSSGHQSSTSSQDWSAAWPPSEMQWGLGPLGNFSKPR